MDALYCLLRWNKAVAVSCRQARLYAESITYTHRNRRTSVQPGCGWFYTDQLSSKGADLVCLLAILSDKAAVIFPGVNAASRLRYQTDLDAGPQCQSA
jgi:hypothetical protein